MLSSSPLGSQYRERYRPGRDWSATVPVAVLSLRRVIVSEDACAPVAIAAPGTDLIRKVQNQQRFTRIAALRVDRLWWRAMPARNTPAGLRTKVAPQSR